eukprot:XP_001692450.1 predicted protein [Chlamydomonas reinhardtii]
MESVVGIVARTVDAAHQLAKTIHGANCKWSYQQWIGLRPGESNARLQQQHSAAVNALLLQLFLASDVVLVLLPTGRGLGGGGGGGGGPLAGATEWLSRLRLLQASGVLALNAFVGFRGAKRSLQESLNQHQQPAAKTAAGAGDAALAVLAALTGGRSAARPPPQLYFVSPTVLFELGPLALSPAQVHSAVLAALLGADGADGYTSMIGGGGGTADPREPHAADGTVWVAATTTGSAFVRLPDPFDLQPPPCGCNGTGAGRFDSLMVLSLPAVYALPAEWLGWGHGMAPRPAPQLQPPELARDAAGAAGGAGEGAGAQESGKDAASGGGGGGGGAGPAGASAAGAAVSQGPLVPLVQVDERLPYEARLVAGTALFPIPVAQGQEQSAPSGAQQSG